MKGVIVHADGRCINLAEPLDPELYDELEGTQGHNPRANPILRCGGCQGGVHIRHGWVSKDELYFAHFDGGNCDETLIACKTAPMSDEHKRQAEYHVRAAERAGHSADLEVRTSTGTRVDVVVDGRIGFEVQRSDLTKVAAVNRTARSVAAGLEAVAWCTDREISPPWIGYVPGYRTTLRGWKSMPPERSAGAAGIETVERALRPVLVRGRYQTREVPRRVQVPMLVDDVVPALAERRLRPVLLAGYVQLLTTAGITLWEELTGEQLAAYNAGKPKARPQKPSAEDHCTRERVTITSATPAIIDTRHYPGDRSYVIAQCERYGWDTEKILTQIDKAAESRFDINSGKCTCDFTGLPASDVAGHRANHEMFNRCYQVAARQALSDDRVNSELIASPEYQVTRDQCRAPGCGESARLYPAGWLCDAHRPGAISTSIPVAAGEAL